MKVSTLLFFIFFSLCKVQAQYITASPNAADFCNYSMVTYSVFPPSNPNNSIVWKIADYVNYSITGQENYTTVGTGTTLNVYTGQMGSTCMRIEAYEVDALGNFVNGNSFPQVSNYLNNDLPVYYSYYNCGSLSIPSVADPNLWPGRWGMWYRDGIPTGLSDVLLYGPFIPGQYQYKLKLSCGDTLFSYPVNVSGPPTVSLTANGPTTFCTGDSVTLNLQGSVNVLRWWYNNTQIAGSGGKTSLIAKAAGSYRVEVYSGSGSSQCYQLTNTINVTVNPGAYITGASVACTGDSTLLSCTTAASYQWKKNGVNIAGANQQTLWVKTTGSYQVVTSGLTCNTSTAKQVTFYGKPTISTNLTGTQVLCYGSAMTLVASGTNTTSYSWLRNNVAQSGVNNDSLTITKTGNYKCIVSNQIGCTKASGVIYVVAPTADSLPVKTLVLQPAGSGVDAYVTSAFGAQSSNFGGSSTIEVSNWYKYFRTGERGLINFDLSSLPSGTALKSATLRLYADTAAVYQNGSQTLFFRRSTEPWSESAVNWYSSPDSTVFQQTTVNFTASLSNSYLSVSITDIARHWTKIPAENYGLLIYANEPTTPVSWVSFYSSDWTNASQRPKLTLQYYGAALDSSGPLSFCSGGNVVLSTDSGNFTYTWLKNGQIISGATQRTYTATQTGQYQVIISNAAGCTAASPVRTVNATVLSNPVVTAAGPTSFCAGQSVMLNSTTANNVAYQWQKNQANISGATQSSLFVTQAGSYRMRHYLNGCYKFSNSINVTVPCRVGEEEGEELSIINEPASSFVIVRIANPLLCESIHIDIYNLSGQLMQSLPCSGEETMIDRGLFRAGLAVMKIREGEVIRRTALLNF